LKGGVSGKEGRGKEKRFMKGKERGDSWKGETVGRREKGKRRGLFRRKEGETVERGRQWEGGKREREEVYKGERKGDGWKAETVGRKEEGKRRGLLR
jgi:hypothetical protein